MSNSNSSYYHSFVYPSGSKKVIAKRRKMSPKIFPKKIHITEEVMNDFSRMNITNTKQRRHQRSFSEIEASLSLDDSDHEDDRHQTFIVEQGFQEELRRFKYSLLKGAAKRKTSALMPSTSNNTNTALVLYQPRLDILAECTKSPRSESSHLDHNDHDEEIKDHHHRRSLPVVVVEPTDYEPMEL